MKIVRVKSRVIGANGLLRILILAIPISVCPSFARPVHAIVPEVRNVVAYDVGDSIFLKITVYHYPEISSHYVDMIEVTVGTNVTDLNISIQPLDLDYTFTVPYDLDPVSGTPIVTVRAHCTFNGWSNVNWSGQVPDFRCLSCSCR